MRKVEFTYLDSKEDIDRLNFGDVVRVSFNRESREWVVSCIDREKIIFVSHSPVPRSIFVYNEKISELGVENGVIIAQKSFLFYENGPMVDKYEELFKEAGLVSRPRGDKVKW